jgi:hypothetical protein
LSKNIYIGGPDDKAKKVTKCYIGVDGVAKKILKAFIGDENGKARLVYSAHTHSWVVHYSSDNDLTHNKYEKCSDPECGEEASAVVEDHTWKLTESKNPTCKEEGYEHSQCQACGRKKEETLEVTDHKWIQGDKIDATCLTSPGVVNYCEYCNEESINRTGAPLGHSFAITEQGTVNNEGAPSYVKAHCQRDNCDNGGATVEFSFEYMVTSPTCTNVGEAKYLTSEVYGQQTGLYLDLPKLEHTRTTDKIINNTEWNPNIAKYCWAYPCIYCGEATELHDAYDDHDWNEREGSPISCKRCGVSYTEWFSYCTHSIQWNYVSESALVPYSCECTSCGRKDVNLEARAAVEATCTKPGAQTYYSKEFNAYAPRTSEIDPLGHMMYDWSSLNEVSHRRTCVRYNECGHSETQSHNYKNGKCTVCDYECTHAWTEEGICSICKQECVHRYEGVTEKSATCTEDGYFSGTCAICNKTVYETYPASGHTYTGGSYNGSKVDKCYYEECTSCRDVQYFDHNWNGITCTNAQCGRTMTYHGILTAYPVGSTNISVRIQNDGTKSLSYHCYTVDPFGERLSETTGSVGAGQGTQSGQILLGIAEADKANVTIRLKGSDTKYFDYYISNIITERTKTFGFDG